jgi:hypothetical protein
MYSDFGLGAAQFAPLNDPFRHNFREEGGPERSLPKPAAKSPQVFTYVLLHRKWLILSVFFLVTAVPRFTPTGFLISFKAAQSPRPFSQQILSATRLQKIIETLNLYPEERKPQFGR